MHTEFAQTHAQQAIDACLEAHKACLQTAAHSMQAGYDWVTPRLLQRLHDCADLTLTTAHLLMRASPYHRPAAHLCATATADCAEALEPHAQEDAQVRTAHAACLAVHRACAELTGKEEPARSDAHDEALRETFPGSDPTPPPTEL